MTLLETQNLSRSFGGLKALNDATIAVERNKITALIGPNGAGKTTAFNLISGLLPVSSGAVIFEGRDITGRPPYTIAHLGIARTFQNIRIFPNMNALENVMVGLHTRSRCGFLSSALKLPGTSTEEHGIKEGACRCLEFMGIENLATKNAANLAFGQQRLLEMARALALKPKLILLDEPAAGLNSQETIRLGEVISKILESGVTVFIVEHDMELVMSISHTVIVLNNGMVIASGSPSEIQCNDEVITAYLGED